MSSTTPPEDTTTRNDLTETKATLQARLEAQTQITATRDALLRAAMALPNDLQYLAEGGSFASTIVDLTRAIADARHAQVRRRLPARLARGPRPLGRRVPGSNVPRGRLSERAPPGSYRYSA